MSHSFNLKVGYKDAQELAHVVDSMYAKGAVKLLNYAYISLERKDSILGSGDHLSFQLLAYVTFNASAVIIDCIFYLIFLFQRFIFKGLSREI
jgi:hypothetical protein